MSVSSGTSSGELDGVSRRELYELAKERGIEGRSGMDKGQLRQALDGGNGTAPERRTGSRIEEFRRLAAAGAGGEFVMLPRSLSGNDRRRHVRQTLREDHQTRISQGAEDAQVKFDQLAGSVFSFFRGTALLFYRDIAGEDSWMPTVLTLGDVHPENFGVMPNADNVPIFSVNDFDEAYYAPFTWDLKRGAVGFMLAAQEEGGYGRKRQRKIAACFAHALSDEIGQLDHDIEPLIVEAIGPPELFVDDIVRFADEAAERVRGDHETFKADHELGAFERIDLIYR